MKIYKPLIIAILLLGFQFEGISQNLLENGDFSANGGSLDGWGTASGTSLGNEGSDYYAILHGENGVLYQKVSNITPGKTYTVTMKFRNLKVKQTTGYGFAIEFDTPLVLPEFSIGATNLRNFCQDNNGEWTTLEDNLSEQNVSKSYNLLLLENAKAVYICVGTKGAVADMKIDEVNFQKVVATNVTFLVTNKITGLPLENAEVLVDGFSNFSLTDSEGKAAIELVSSNEPYRYTVSRDWFKAVESTVTVGETDLNVSVEMDSIQEIRNVETRISKYGDNATPYPIFGHFWSSGLNYSDAISDSITNALDYMVGGGGLENTKAVSEKLHQSNPDFQIIRYQGGWDIKASQVEGRRMDLLYYRCGVLASGISTTDNTFVLNKTPDNKGLGLVASEEGSFTTWIRIGNELMKILSVSGSSYPLTVTVERGFEGSVSQAHNAGSAATAPLFEVIPVRGGNNSNMSFFDPVFGPRKADLLRNSLSVAIESGQDGIWIDILVGLLGAQNMVGGNYTLWNHDKEGTLSNEDIVAATKDALNDIYIGFYARMGFFPVIYGNNVLYSSSFNTGDRAYVMVKDEEHPRGLDGFCHENSWGHMSDDSGNIDNDGDPVTSSNKFIAVGENGHYLEWYMGNTWIDHCKAIALLAEKNLPNQPMTINAGYKNQWFASDLPDEIRYDFNKFAYVSYLLCINVSPDSLISCRMGISPQIVKNGTTTIGFEPFFYYPVGIPTQTNNYNSFTQYRVGNHNLFARKFSEGIVLINPFSTEMTASVNIDEVGESGETYIDPENDDERVFTVQLKSRESKILLKKSDVTGTKSTIEREEQRVEVFPVPAQEQVHFKLNISSTVLKKFTLELFNMKGTVLKRIQTDSATTKITVSCEELPAGLYLYRIPELAVNGKFIKSTN